MAEEGAGDRTEQATPKRRGEARRKGQVARSQELNSVLVLLSGGAVTLAAFAWMSSGIRQLGVFFFDGIDTLAIDSVPDAADLFALLLQRGGVLLVPTLLTVLVVGTGVAAAQVGLKWSVEAMAFRWNKLNPIEGSKKFFNKTALFELTKNLLKVGILGLVSWLTITDLLPRTLLVGMAPPAAGWVEVGSIVRALLLRLMAVLAVIGIADYWWQRRKFEDSIKMTVNEVRQEGKDLSGDPQIKARIRSIQLELSRSRMLEDTRTADVVVTNPTHYSVAIKYDRSEPAPRVVAKGQGYLALRIREVAAEAGVPCVENVELARGLYHAVKVGEFIPTQLYEAAAQVLAAVYRADRASAATANAASAATTGSASRAGKA